MTEPFSKELMKKWDWYGYRLEQYFNTDGTRKSFVFIKRRQIFYGSRISSFTFNFCGEKLEIKEFDKGDCFNSFITKRKPTLTMYELSCVNETIKELGWKE